MSNRLSLSILMLTALLSWGGLLLFTHWVPPRAFPAFLALFLILTIALTGTAAPIIYTIARIFSSTPPHQSTIRGAVRQGTLFALIVVLNLMLRVLHSWNVMTAILIVLAMLVVEVVVLRK